MNDFVARLWIKRIPIKFLRDLVGRYYSYWRLSQVQKCSNTGTYVTREGASVKVNKGSLSNRKGMLIRTPIEPVEFVKMKKNGPDETRFIKRYNYQ